MTYSVSPVAKFDLLVLFSKKISNDQEPIQSEPKSCPQNKKENS